MSSWNLRTAGAPWASWTSWSFCRSPGLLGLDLADDSLRLVELQQRKSTLVLCVADIQALPPGAVVDGDIQQFDVVASALGQCLLRHPLRTSDVAMALPTAAVRLDTWQAPLGLDEDGLATLVAEHVEQRWSAEPDDLSLDYGYVPDEGGGGPGLGRVWVAAAAMELVQDRQGLAQACGLRLTDLESQAEASRRAAQVPATTSLLPAQRGHSLEPALATVPPFEGTPTPPFAGMRLGPSLVKKGWPSEPALYAIACGLALRRFGP